MYRKHRNELGAQTATISANSVQTFSQPEGIPANSADSVSRSLGLVDEALSKDLSFHQNEINQLLGTDGQAQKRESALFLLHLKEEKGLSQSAINEVVIASQKLFKHTISRVEAGVEDCLSKEAFLLSDIPGLSALFSNVKDPFSGLISQFLQEKFYKEELQCVVSMMLLLLF